MREGCTGRRDGKEIYLFDVTADWIGGDGKEKALGWEERAIFHDCVVFLLVRFSYLVESSPISFSLSLDGLGGFDWVSRCH
jgi:hypothetical protein